MTPPERPLYARGQWHRAVDASQQLEDAHENACGDTSKALLVLGFEQWATIGNPDHPAPLSLCVHRREAHSPHFYIQIHGIPGTFIEEVFAGDIADLMDLLTRWAPPPFSQPSPSPGSHKPKTPHLP